MDIRRNHRDMTPNQKEAFISAILKLKNEVPSVLRPGLQCRYDDFVQIHKNSMGRGNPIVPNPHRTPLFFPWHRILIRQFELELQKTANDSSITLPYWNWSMSGNDNPFTDDFMGRDGDPQQNQHVTLGPFAYQRGEFGVRIDDNDEGDSGLRRNFGVSGEPLPTAEEVASVLNKTPYWSEPDGWENLTERMHNVVHGWVGGNMATASSPNDPVFFLHHCYLDFLWERWKHHNPAEHPISIPEGVPDALLQATLVFHPFNELAPWAESFTVEQTLHTDRLDYRYEGI